MTYAFSSLDELGDGPGFRKIRKPLGITAFGVNGVVYPPNYPGVSHYQVRDVHLRGSLPRTPTTRQVDVLAAFVAAGGSVAEAAARVGVRPSTAKRHLDDPHV